MHNTITRKVPNGKLVRIKIDFDKEIESVQITGDFFMHPEHVVEEFEKILTGLPCTSSQNEMQKALDGIVNEYGAELIGVTTEAIADMVKETVR